ncbi:uncharacterized protein BDR25DRAFT_109542 [Lindgomyces ingoldianus]|uniref:Uncharacterized protein n=1 Tax=Lindgomyces ingoldianus TaxID=673940 RepID=A0ACB6R6S7_9PLEO|nr:uncharacterized protein BDR25DRAFT_109542 [Lindgomyces ingoldianus]KAF2474533.1 hypothetical protein BDR25DRAFT_109542 [Lindgomyces ingoldianus]
MKEPRTALWALRISNADLTKLKAGVEPRNQDNKWRIWVSDQSGSGNMSITVTRVMFSRDIYILHVKPGDSSDGGHSIEALTWEQNNSGVRVSEEEAKKKVVVLSRNLLGCDIEALPEYDKSVMWNYSAVKKEAN